MANYDWYSATFAEDPEDLVAPLCKGLDLASVRPARALNGYHRAAMVHRGDRELCRLMWGGNPGTHVRTSGDNARQVVPILKMVAPAHRVSRVDVCEDWIEGGLFDCIAGQMIKYAKANRIRINQQGDWVNGKARTLYLGARSSIAQLVLYEKGHQLDANPDWLRMELRVYPNKHWKGVVANYLPGELFGVVPWVKDLLRTLGWDHLEARTIGTVWRPSDEDRARRYLVRQYGPTLERWAAEVGSQNLGDVLLRTIQDHREGREPEPVQGSDAKQAESTSLSTGSEPATFL